MELLTFYQIGFAVLILYAFFWSFILDQNKPATKREFVAKLIARALLLMFIFTALVGFAYYAFGFFDVTPAE